MIYLISFNKFSDVLPTFTCASTIGNLWSICLGVNILSPSPRVAFVENILLLKALRVNCRPSWRAYALSQESLFSFLPSSVFGLDL